MIVSASSRRWDVIAINRAAGALDAADLGGPLPVLIAHDAAQGTDYVSTLGTWVRYPGEPQRAARELRIHSNTLRYRLRRLLAIAPVDVHDPHQRLALQLQIETIRGR